MQYIKKNNAIIDILRSGRNGPVIRNPGNNINNIFGNSIKKKTTIEPLHLNFLNLQLSCCNKILQQKINY